VETVATTADGIAELWDAIVTHRGYLDRNGHLAARRAKRAREEAVRIAKGRFERALDAVIRGPDNGDLLDALKNRQMDPEEAADRLVAAVALELRDEQDPGAD
jgi:LAO/AO transport system kinase